MRLGVYVFLAVCMLLTAAAVRAQAPVVKNCVTMCTIISDPAPAEDLPFIAACQLLNSGTQVADAPLKNNGCYFDVTIPLGENRSYTARWRTQNGGTTVGESNVLNIQSRPTLAPPSNFKLVP